MHKNGSKNEDYLLNKYHRHYRRTFLIVAVKELFKSVDIC